MRGAERHFRREKESDVGLREEASLVVRSDNYSLTPAGPPAVGFSVISDTNYLQLASVIL